MSDLATTLSELALAADGLAGRPLAVPGLRIWRSTAPTPPVPALFEPVFYVVLQGAKQMTSAGITRPFGRGTSAVATIGLPFVHQVIEASPGTPYLGVEIRLESAVVADLLLAMPAADDAADDGAGIGFAVTSVDAASLEPLGRLLEVAGAPDDAALLAPAIVREICYRLLKGPMRGTLRQLGRRGSHFAQIRAAADWIGAHVGEPVRVAGLATRAGMSVTSFHRHFKAVTGYSPLAYQRHLRLIEARRLLVAREVAVTAAGFAVGYASPSQFSRDYKRMFGRPPVADLRDASPSSLRSATSPMPGDRAGRLRDDHAVAVER